jgi:hypothetical protein
VIMLDISLSATAHLHTSITLAGRMQYCKRKSRGLLKIEVKSQVKRPYAQVSFGIVHTWCSHKHKAQE